MLFFRHLHSSHILDARTTAQVRIQMEVVTTMEKNLRRQKKILEQAGVELRLTQAETSSLDL